MERPAATLQLTESGLTPRGGGPRASFVTILMSWAASAVLLIGAFGVLAHV